MSPDLFSWYSRFLLSHRGIRSFTDVNFEEMEILIGLNMFNHPAFGKRDLEHWLEGLIKISDIINMNYDLGKSRRHFDDNFILIQYAEEVCVGSFLSWDLFLPKHHCHPAVFLNKRFV